MSGISSRPLSAVAAVVLVGSGFMGAAAQQTDAATVDVYKSPTCRCCSNWIEHMHQNGFAIRTTQMPEGELASFKARHSVPRQAQSCHTALIGEYVVEGHVPASDVRRLLKERPSILGLAVAGMQRGSPGMEAWGAEPQPYTVTVFDRQGNIRVFATRRQ